MAVRHPVAAPGVVERRTTRQTVLGGLCEAGVNGQRRVDLLSVGAAEVKEPRNKGGSIAHRKPVPSMDNILEREVVADVVVDGDAR